MIKQAMSDTIEEWGERLYSSPVKRSKGRNIRHGGPSQPAKPVPKSNGSLLRQKIIRTAQKTPEVMVKISGGCKNMPRIKAHMDYISRHGQLDLEDEKGDIHRGKEGLCDVRDAWSKGRIGISEISERRKEAFNIVLSMPPGTDRQAVKEAARAFAQEQFKDHQYIFAAHNDEKHPHVHLCVKAVDYHGIRLNPRKGDLQFWREQFAEKLRDQGIAANATPRRVRGIVQKSEKQVIRHINREFQQGNRKTPSYVSKAQKQAAVLEIEGGKHLINPAQNKIYMNRKEVQQAYGQIARVLAKGDREDKQLALNIVHLVQTMPL